MSAPATTDTFSVTAPTSRVGSAYMWIRRRFLSGRRVRLVTWGRYRDGVCSNFKLSDAESPSPVVVTVRSFRLIILDDYRRAGTTPLASEPVPVRLPVLTVPRRNRNGDQH